MRANCTFLALLALASCSETPPTSRAPAQPASTVLVAPVGGVTAAPAPSPSVDERPVTSARERDRDRPERLTAMDALPKIVGAESSALHRAAPFGESPSDIRSDDGNVYMRWEFRRAEVFACSTMHTYPYLFTRATQAP